MPSAVVVGAGVFGAALARQLAREHWEVTLVEQETPGWDGSASGGESRLLRFSHGGEAWYTRSARRSRELWRAMDPGVLVDCGVAWFAYRDDGWEADSERLLRSEGIAVERLEPGEAARLFPSLAVDDLAWVLFEPEAGVLRADRAVKVLVSDALGAGARLVRGRATPAGDAVEVGASLLEGDRVVWAGGPWLSKLFPDLAVVRATRQEVVFVDTGTGWSSPPVPGWVDYDGSFYGHGDLGGLGVKVACDAEGPAIEPGDTDATFASERLVRDYLARRFPALSAAGIHHVRACPYELTVDTHFIAAPHPEHPAVWLLGGGSGHGFKHGPALAERMAAWLGGDEAPDARFALGPRVADRSLRTAGARATPIGKRLAS